MSSPSGFQSRLYVAIRRAQELDEITRLGRALFKPSFSNQEPDLRRKPQNVQKPYLLTESEYTFLETGEPPGSYRDRPDKLHSRIEEKVDRLPDRIELLFEDVSQLERPSFSEREVGFDVAKGEERGYFTPEQWGEGWMELMDIHPQQDLTDTFVSRPIHSHNPAGEFGRKLGELWAALMLNPHGIPPQQLWIDAIRGFIDGIYLDNLPHGVRDRPHQQQEFIKTLVEEIEVQSMNKIEDRKESEQVWFEEQKARDKARGRALNKVKQLLEEEGIDPLLVDNYVYSELTDFPQPTPSDAEQAIEEKITPEAVRELVEEEQLREKAAILAHLYDDAKAIHEKSGRGPEPIEILKTAYRNEGMSSVEIAKECTKQNHQAAVTETATDLAGERDPNDRPGKVWVEFPILEGDSDGWTLTEYGRLLAEHVSKELGVGIRGITNDHVELIAPKLEY